MLHTDPCRRWMMEISRLRTRMLKARRGCSSSLIAELFDESLATGESLLRELAGAQLRCEELTRTVNAQCLQLANLIQQLPVACVEVTEEGIVVNANQHAGRILNSSPKYLEGRLLLHFAVDREGFAAILHGLPSNGVPWRTSLNVRPREQGAISLDATIVPRVADRERTWLWFLTVSSASVRDTATTSYSNAAGATTCDCAN